MSKDNKKDHRRVSASIKSPFTLSELQEFVGSIPAKAKVRLVSISGNNPEVISGGEQSLPSYLEALWWELLAP